MYHVNYVSDPGRSSDLFHPDGQLFSIMRPSGDYERTNLLDATKLLKVREFIILIGETFLVLDLLEDNVLIA
jgi:hypothetical protein